jgi:hypothetical protein
VLFDGETLLSDILTSSVRDAQAEIGPWDTLFRAFRSAEYLFAEPPLLRASAPHHRQQSCASGTRACQNQIVDCGVSVGATRAGVPDHVAMLAAQMGMAALGHAVACWFDDGASDLDDHLVQAFRKVRDLSSSGSEPIRGTQAAAKT